MNEESWTNESNDGDLTPEQMSAIVDSLVEQGKLPAIKLYRVATGKGLKEAKDFIESLSAELRESPSGESAGGGLTPERVAEIEELLLNRRKIDAIKVYRSATGKGLKESKDFVEAIAAELYERDPEKYACLAKATGGGCAGASALLVGLTVGLVYGLSLLV